MKLYNEEVEVRSEGTFVGSESRIKNSAHMYKVLSKALYSDPYLAIVRELCCNAWDSHIAAGNTGKKFDLCLPNALAPFFKVRDYGTGIATDADVLKMYDYGESTKQQSDVMTGCFGLGAKSPYAYTQKFTTLNYYNGKVTHFISFMDEHGIPQTLKMSEQETDQPNGLEVSFSVEPDDFYSFQTATQRALRPFKIKPNVLGAYDSSSILQEDHRTPMLSGDGWRFYGDGQCHALMGNVSYPLGTTERKGMSENAKKLLRFNIEIDFPMGAFEITPSREAVQWTEYSVNNINDKLEVIYDVVIAHVNQKIQGAKNFWEACIRARELQQTCFRTFISALTYGGRAIVRDVVIPPEFKLMALTADTPRRDSHGQRPHANSVGRYLCGGTIQPNDTKFYFGDYKGSTNKIENMVRHDLARGEKVYYLQHTVLVEKKNEKLGVMEKVPTVSHDTSKLKAFCDSLGLDLDDVQMVSSIPDKPRDPSSRRGRLVGSKARAFLYNSAEYGYQNDLYWNEYECDLAGTPEGVYVEIALWQFKNSVLAEKPRDFKDYKYGLAELGIKFPEDKLVGVKTADLSKFQKASNWKPLDAWVAEKLKEVWDEPDFQFAYKLFYHERHRLSWCDMETDLESYFRELTRLPEHKFVNCPHWTDTIAKLKAALEYTKKAAKFKNCLIDGLSPELDKAVLSTTKEVEALVDASVTRYPLLTALWERYHNSRLYSRLPAVIQYVQLIDNHEVK